MNVYDFDNTIYDGESIYDFFFFVLKKNPYLIIHIPKVVNCLLKHKQNKITIDKLIEVCEKIVRDFLKNNKEDTDTIIENFWKKNKKKLKSEFIKKLTKEDVIITGCPNFLMDYLNLPVREVIGTDYDIKEGKMKFLCFGENKVKIFNERFPNEKINEFYTDSLSDSPLMQLANRGYLVKKNKIILIKDFTEER